MGKTKIEWATDSWNPLRARNKETGKLGWFCIHASEGCRFCYAEGMNRRLGTGLDYKAQNLALLDLFLDEDMLTAPLHWKKPRQIFVCSMTDLFADFVKDEWIDRMFAVMALCPQHTFIVLTKRPERMREWSLQEGGAFEHGCRIAAASYLEALECDHAKRIDARSRLAHWPLRNVWLGTSCEDQKTADKRIPHLLATPAAIRFVSYEPALGPVDFENVGSASWKSAQLAQDVLRGECWRPLEPIGARIDWLICGGESGPNARPMHPDWARSVRDQCAAAGIPFFHKQNGEFAPGEIAGEFLKPDKTAKGFGWNGQRWAEAWSEVDGHADDEPDVYRVGKKRAGRLLDGVEHNGFPSASSARAAGAPRETPALETV